MHGTLHVALDFLDRDHHPPDSETAALSSAKSEWSGAQGALQRTCRATTLFTYHRYLPLPCLSGQGGLSPTAALEGQPFPEGEKGPGSLMRWEL